MANHPTSSFLRGLSTVETASSKNVMARSLQHAAAGLDKASADTSFSLTFPLILVAAVAAISAGILFFEFTHKYVCRVYFGRVEPLTDEEILAVLSDEDQRKAALEAIFSKDCKPATESDVSQRKHKRGDTETEMPITDLTIPIPALSTAETDGSTITEGHTDVLQDDPHSLGRAGVDMVEDDDLSKIVINTPDTGGITLEDTDEAEERSFNSSAAENLPIIPPLVRHESLTSMASEQTFDDESTVDHACPICLVGYKKGDMLIVSEPCTHMFHKDCILEWLVNHEECPICRVKMVTEAELLTAARPLVEKAQGGREL